MITKEDLVLTYHAGSDANGTVQGWRVSVNVAESGILGEYYNAVASRTLPLDWHWMLTTSDESPNLLMAQAPDLPALDAKINRLVDLFNDTPANLGWVEMTDAYRKIVDFASTEAVAKHVAEQTNAKEPGPQEPAEPVYDITSVSTPYPVNEPEAEPQVDLTEWDNANDEAPGTA